MELMGDWNRGTLDTLTTDKAELGTFLGWFPFPAISGAAGDPKAALGGGDGFACAKNAPAECVEFLKYIVSPEVQKGYAATGTGLPVAKGAADGVDRPGAEVHPGGHLPARATSSSGWTRPTAAPSAPR